MHLDTRLWMYRRGEARLFGHPGDVPHGEGWQRFPVVFDDDVAAADSPEAASPDVEPLETMSRRGLLQLAAECGLKVDPGWTKARLRQALGEVLHDYGA
ncbi:hypothetical protein JDN40_03100 [Rhodomicrobium vannielii ATCC 17100]|uniref:hypothetical protein n=1 Tax=Rhodomicrobium vannielii TaxID=1069 RepID=UPI00191B0C87|nr:hypothetical protein [Rhodomicrobium vannielii]MBJ7533100.1 hypothetical protein [Rhodomicrobium vannielii ATCC 17100]